MRRLQAFLCVLMATGANQPVLVALCAGLLLGELTHSLVCSHASPLTVAYHISLCFQGSSWLASSCLQRVTVRFQQQHAHPVLPSTVHHARNLIECARESVALDAQWRRCRPLARRRNQTRACVTSLNPAAPDLLRSQSAPRLHPRRRRLSLGQCAHFQ